MNEMMSYIKVNDIFDELSDENNRLKHCLNVLIDFKKFVDFVFNDLKTNLDSNDSQKLEELNHQIKDVLEINGFSDFSVLKENNSKDELISKSAKNVTKISSKNVNIIKTTDKHNDRYLTETEEPIVRKSRSGYVCEFSGCGKSMRTIKLYKKHVRTHGLTHYYYSCDFVGCGFSSNGRTFFLDHMNKHKGLRPYECDYCKKTFHSNDYLNRHKRRECPKLGTLDNGQRQPFVCDFDDCNKEFLTQYSLDKHKKNHFKEKCFKCLDCDFRTSEPKQLHWHKLAKHLNRRPFKCEVEGCVRTFVNEYQLNAHTMIHNLGKSYKCSAVGCDKSYARASHLKVHWETIHSGIVYPCEWPGCDYKGSKRNLEVHSFVHKTVGHLVCDWPECGKRFKFRKGLVSHSRIHTSDKRYVCSWPGCQYRCVFGGNLNKHMRVHRK